MQSQVSQDTRLIMMVAQRPFESGLNRFCKLVPLLYSDGTLADLADFPDDGEIWWMLTPQTDALATPGHLITGIFEPSVVNSSDGKPRSQFQVVRSSVRTLELKEGLEIIDIPTSAITALHDLVDGRFTLPLQSRPTTKVFLRWHGTVYGPFTVTSANTNDGRDRYAFTTGQHESVFAMPQAKFQTLVGQHCHVFKTPISQTGQSRQEGYTKEVKHEFLHGSGFEIFLAERPEVIPLEPLERKVLRFAKEALPRKRRQELKSILEELDLKGRETPDSQEVIAVVDRIRASADKVDQALDTLVKNLFSSGVLGEDRIAKAEKEHADRYINDRVTSLQSQIDERLKEKKDELRKVEDELKVINTRLQREAVERKAQLDNELKQRRDEEEKNRAKDLQNLETQRQELERLQTVLKVNLEEVTKELRSASDGVVNKFIAIAPLLGMQPAGTSFQVSPPSEASHLASGAKPRQAFKVPAYATAAWHADGKAISEVEFFERFRQVVDKSGFNYRDEDLIRFHLSVKTTALTVLGGPSGTGKSSLPVLYTNALLGDELVNGRPSCLMVNVNPSWMEGRDLLGHLNTLEGEFYPAESGLYQQLIAAQEEARAKGSSSGLHLVCLDEMNLAQPEHYFGDFLMILERDGANRKVRCFSAESIRRDSDFQPYACLDLSPAVRFIGTVNFDETTRPLSDRLLDRTNLIKLQAAKLQSSATAGLGLAATVQGPMVTESDMETWGVTNVLPQNLAGLLDQLRPALSDLGYPISPRTYRGVCQYVSSATKLTTPEKAFDWQLAQRVFPKIRPATNRRQSDKLLSLRGILESSGLDLDESIGVLEDIQNQFAAGGMLEEE